MRTVSGSASTVIIQPILTLSKNGHGVLKHAPGMQPTSFPGSLFFTLPRDPGNEVGMQKGNFLLPGNLTYLSLRAVRYTSSRKPLRVLYGVEIWSLTKTHEKNLFRWVLHSLAASLNVS